MTTPGDEFLSEEDLDLRALPEEELLAYWDMWLRQAQATNDLDRLTYSHGVFVSAPEPADGARPGPPSVVSRPDRRYRTR